MIEISGEKEFIEELKRLEKEEGLVSRALNPVCFQKGILDDMRRICEVYRFTPKELEEMTIKEIKMIK